MNGDLSGYHIDHGAGSRPSHHHPPLIRISGERWAYLVHRFLVEHHRPLDGGSKTGSVGAEVRDSFFPLFFRLGAMAAGRVGVRLDRGKGSAAFRKVKELRGTLQMSGGRIVYAAVAA